MPALCCICFLGSGIKLLLYLQCNAGHLFISAFCQMKSPRQSVRPGLLSSGELFPLLSCNGISMSLIPASYLLSLVSPLSLHHSSQHTVRIRAAGGSTMAPGSSILASGGRGYDVVGQGYDDMVSCDWLVVAIIQNTGSIHGYRLWEGELWAAICSSAFSSHPR